MPINLKLLGAHFDPTDLEWRPIANSRYEVSNDGRLRDSTTNRAVKSYLKKSGYMAGVIAINCVRQNVLIHRLVALAFLPVTERKMLVNHIDGNKTNNRISNLEWSTSSENNRHAHKIGLNYISDANKVARIKAVKEKLSIPIICTTTGVVYSGQTECARVLGLQQANIQKVLAGNRKHTGGLRFEYAR